MNSSQRMMLAYVFGQGFYFGLMLLMLLLDQKKIFAWLGLSGAYFSFAFQLSDLGSVSIGRQLILKLDIKLILAYTYAKTVIGILMSLPFIYGAMLLGKKNNLSFEDILIPLMFALFSKSKASFLEHINHTAYAQMISLQWISACLGALVDIVFVGENMLFSWILPLSVNFIYERKYLSHIVLKNSGISFSVFMTAIVNIIPIAINALAGQFWGRAVLLLIAANFGLQEMSEYSLARGVITGVIMVFIARVRGSFLDELSNGSVKSTRLYPEGNVKMLVIAVLMSISGAIAFSIINSGLVGDKNHVSLCIAGLATLPIFIFIYTYKNFQFYYYVTTYQTQLYVEILGYAVMVLVFYFLFDYGYLSAVILSDIAKYIVSVAVSIQLLRRLKI